jgi:hypothetical protein
MMTALFLAQTAPRAATKTVIAILPVLIAGVLVVLLLMWYRQFRARLRRKASQMGYASIGAYLRAVPRSQAERQAAVDMTAKGVVLCVLGVLAPPLIIIGLFPLYYGGRKLLMIGAGIAPATPGGAPGTESESGR